MSFNLKKKLKKYEIRNPAALFGLLAAALSFLFPWWQIYFPNEGGGIYVYPYTVNIGVVVPAIEIETTTVRLIAFTAILLVAISLTLFGAFKKGWKGRALIGLSGLFEIGIGYIFRDRIYERVLEVAEHGVGMFPAPIDLPAEGISDAHGAKLITSFELGLDLIFAAGIITIISVILHDKFVIKLDKYLD